MNGRGNAIVLIGFMGTGKSSVGRELARRTNLPRYDTDEVVTKRFGFPIAEIFARHGEPAFRDAEADAIATAPDGAAIIVTGGGALLRGGQVEHVRRLGSVVRLTADVATLMARLSRRPSRPLLRADDPRAAVERLLAQREPFYRQAADFSVDTSHLTHEEVAEAVLAGLDANLGT